MCGLSFLYSFKDQYSCDVLTTMNDAIRHRGPDGEGFFFHPQTTPHTFRVGLGHRRLKILDLSDLSQQPMRSDCGRFVMIFNGEIYNFKDLRDHLIAKGYAFHSKGDTEVLLKAYQEWGTICLQKIKGMFSLIIFDTENNRVFMARDPFGIKPLYYWVSPQGFFAAASEIKQFLGLPGWKSTANTQRIEEYLAQGLQDHTHETLFEGVYQLRPGHYYEGILTPHHPLVTQPYFSLNDHSPTPLSFPKACKHFRDLFLTSLAEHRESDVPIGCGVSGGLDSSAIVYGLAHQEPKTPLTTFSTYSPDDGYDERPYIQKVHQDIHGQHHLIPPHGALTLEQMRRVTWFHDEPLGTPSILCEWAVYDAVAQTPIKVTLEGHGADEILGGYLTFIPFYLKHLWNRKRYGRLIVELFSVSFIYGWLIKRKVTSILSKGFPWRTRNRWAKGFLKSTPSSFVALNYTPTPRASTKDWRSQELYHSSLPKQLHWADRDAMAHSIEARVPFLDKDLVAYVMNCPGSTLFRKGWSKSLVRHGLSDILPPCIQKRTSKIGFPFSGTLDFFKTPEVRTFIEESSQRIPLSPEIQKTVTEALHKGIYDETLWRVFSVMVWSDTFTVQYPS